MGLGIGWVSGEGQQLVSLVLVGLAGYAQGRRR